MIFLSNHNFLLISGTNSHQLTVSSSMIKIMMGSLLKCNFRFQAGNAEGILFLSVLEFGKTNLILKFDVSIKAWVGPDEGLPKNISQ